MKDILKQAVTHNWAFWICLVVSVFLIVGGCIVPPPFVIDSSIFIAVGELLAFAALGNLGAAIEKGIDYRIKHGDTTIEVGDRNGRDGEEE